MMTFLQKKRQIIVAGEYYEKGNIFNYPPLINDYTFPSIKSFLIHLHIHPYIENNVYLPLKTYYNITYIQN